ncbi:ABC transporter ATP-binding protein [Mumia sp. zg.B17]|uniref:ABC transporter ATP-binding protein n=1 Tax=Mumia sp. zg.B17 TaxID=2855446 RepID=UPI001C6F1C49|nr:ABC transporter ATP-binding protein [Mumia sp. zg.B17]MBW9204548.1 ABC transporter ATP-binding protein [Mumia sp. zg.B17]
MSSIPVSSLASAVPGGVQTPTDTAAARTRGLVKTYGRGPAEVRALDGVDLTIERARLTAIMGPSGSGKSTLMHCLAGLDSPTSGEVEVAGTGLGDLDDNALTRFRREHVGFVFQAFNLLPTLTARHNILLPLDLAGREPDLRRFDTLIEVLGLADRLSHRPSELSGGQQQRVAIARALLSSPDVVFADEPTGNLDSRSSAEVLDFLRRSVDELAQTVVMVTHEPTAAAYADRVLLLRDGRLAGTLERPTAEDVVTAIAGLDA